MSGVARAAAAHGAATGSLFRLHAALQDADVGGGAHALDNVHDLGRRLLAQPVRAEPALRARDGHAGAEAGVEVESRCDPGVLHGYLAGAAAVPQSAEALAGAAAWLKGHLA